MLGNTYSILIIYNNLYKNLYKRYIGVYCIKIRTKKASELYSNNESQIKNLPSATLRAHRQQGTRQLQESDVQVFRDVCIEIQTDLEVCNLSIFVSDTIWPN